jgi:hypothetical protein
MVKLRKEGGGGGKGSVTLMGENRNGTYVEFWLVMEDLHMDGRIILKLIFKEYNG